MATSGKPLRAMTHQEQQVAETAGAHIGDAFNVLHWAILAKASGADLASRRALAVEHLRKAEQALIGEAA